MLMRDIDGFKAYENEDDVTKDLAEFSLANAIFAALTEGYACEQSARYVSIVCVLFLACNPSSVCSRNAMDNASKNASDMIERLTMQYNRGRQAAITNELVDIITGTAVSNGFEYGLTLFFYRCQCLVSGEGRYG